MKCILDTVQILKIAVSLGILDTVSKILPNPAIETYVTLDFWHLYSPLVAQSNFSFILLPHSKL